MTVLSTNMKASQSIKEDQDTLDQLSAAGLFLGEMMGTVALNPAGRRGYN